MCVVGGWAGEVSESGRCNPGVFLEELNPIKDPNDSLFLQWHHTRMPPSYTRSLWAGSWGSGLPWKMPHRRMAACGSSLALIPVRACVWPLLVTSIVLLFPPSRAPRAALNFCSPKKIHWVSVMVLFRFWATHSSNPGARWTPIMVYGPIESTNGPKVGFA